MKFRIIIRAEAENDLRNAFLWYEDKREGLGHDFLLQVDAGLKFIERNPDIYSIEYNGTRKHFVRRFPYKLIYTIHGKTIVVLAVMHCKRNPKYFERE